MRIISWISTNEYMQNIPKMEIPFVLSVNICTLTKYHQNWWQKDYGHNIFQLLLAFFLFSSSSS